MLLPPPQNDVIPQFRAKSQDEMLYSPNTGAVVNAYVDEAFHGVGTLYADINASEVEGAKGKPITPDEYQKSEYFRPGVGYYGGMTDSAAKVLAKYHDDRAVNADIINRASKAQSALGIAAALTTGIAEPKNLISGIATGGVLGLGRSAVMGARTIVAAKRANSGYAAAAGMGALDGLVSAAVMEPSNRYSANTLQQDYTMADSLFNVATSGLLGAGLHVAPKFIKERFFNAPDKVKAYDTTLTEIDTARDQLAQGKRVDVGAVEKVAAPKRGITDALDIKANWSTKDEIDPFATIRNADDESVQRHGDFVYNNRINSNRFSAGDLDKDGGTLSTIESYPDGTRLVGQNGDFYIVKPGSDTAANGYTSYHYDSIATLKTDGGTISNFSVSPEYRGRGLGQKLLKAADDYGINILDTPDRTPAFLKAVDRYFYEKGSRNLPDATTLRKAVHDDLDPNNDTAIDHNAADALDNYESLELDADQAKLFDDYMKEIANMKRDGVLNEADETAMNDAFASIDEEAINKAWEAAYACLTRG